MSSAGISIYGGHVVVHPMDETGPVTRVVGPLTLLSVDGPANQLGDAIRDSLQRSGDFGWRPSFLRRRGQHSELLRLIGATSERAFLKAGRLMHAYKRSTQIEVLVFHRFKGGWSADEPSAILSDGCSAADLGEAVMGLLGKQAAQLDDAADDAAHRS